MNENLSKNWIYIIPSFYGLMAWIFAIILFNIGIVNSDSISLKSVFVVLYVLMSFVFSIYFNKLFSKNIIIKTSCLNYYRSDLYIFIFSTIIGLYGLYIYIRDFSDIIGGISSFLYALSNSALAIREISIENTSIGFQLSYFSWISIFFGVCIICSPNTKLTTRIIIGTIILFEFSLNLTFVDRTRPTWLLVIIILAIAFFRGGDKLKIGTSILITVGVVLGMFFAFAVLTGKYDIQYGLIENFTLYTVGGIGYLDSMVNFPSNDEFTLVRTFYPIAKFLEAVGMLNDVPSQVLEPKLIPFWMNVGTFVEPIYSDGGFVFFLAATPLLIVIVDRSALFFYSKNNFASRLVWANLIFSAMISFFVPKFNSVPIYIFLTLAILFNMAKASRSLNDYKKGI
jgi:hypothetical protein